MPDLNLIDEGGFDDVPEAPATPPAKKSVKSSGGGGAKTLFIVALVLCLLAVAAYFLNRRGIIRLWGKKQPAVVQVQEEFPPEAVPQQPAQSQKLADTNEVALLDTGAVEEKTEPGKQPEVVKEPEAVTDLKAKSAAQTAKKIKAAKKNEAVIETEFPSKLSGMKGEFTVQVIAYREKSRAEETAKNLEFSGYPSFVEKIPMKGGDWYTVRIGRYPSRDEAKKAVLSFGEQLQAHYVIDKVRSK